MEHKDPTFIDDILMMIVIIVSTVRLLPRVSGKAWNTQYQPRFVILFRHRVLIRTYRYALDTTMGDQVNGAMAAPQRTLGTGYI